MTGKFLAVKLLRESQPENMGSAPPELPDASREDPDESKDEVAQFSNPPLAVPNFPPFPIHNIYDSRKGNLQGNIWRSIFWELRPLCVRVLRIFYLYGQWLFIQLPITGRFLGYHHTENRQHVLKKSRGYRVENSIPELRQEVQVDPSSNPNSDSNAHPYLNLNLELTPSSSPS